MSSIALVLLTRRLSDLSSSGLPIGRSVDLLAQQSEKTSEKKLLRALQRDIENGKSFSEALAAQEDTFSPVYIGLVRAGEASGSFDRVFQELSQWMENEIDLRQRLLTSTIYPAFLLVLASAVCVFLVGFVIPRFQPLFDEFGQALPFPTRVLMLATDGIRWFGWIPALAAALLGVLFWRREGKSRKFIVALLLKFNRLAGPLKALYLERWAYGMSILLRNGLTVTEALSTSRFTFGNALFAAELDLVVQKIHEGYPLAIALAESKLFPLTLREMVAAGEETGELETTFTRIATACRKESELNRRLLAAVLEPALVLGMGCLVGFVALAMLLPLLQMNGSFQ